MNASARAYQQVQQGGENDLLLQYGPLVKRIALHLMGKLPKSVQLDDLIQVGLIGLIEAARQFDVSRGVSFENYAGIRIRGAMLDEVRRMDWAPRSVHRKAREVSRVIHEIEQRTGKSATEAEVIKELGITQEEYGRILHDASVAKLFSLDQEDDQDEHGVPRWEPVAMGSEPDAVLEDEGFQQDLAAAIRELPERDQLVMSLYYEERMSLREIGAVIGVSESRVSQIHGLIALKLRAHLEDWVS